MALLDLLRPQWKHSDIEKRLAAARHIEDNRTDVLLYLATEDPDTSVRLAAAKRLTREEDLRKALASNAAGGDKTVLEALRKPLSRIIAEWARTASDAQMEKAVAWIDELRNLAAPEKVFEDLALQAASTTVRTAAFSGVTHASSLLAIALKETDTALALKALEQLARPAHLESVAKNAVNADARKTAKARLGGLAAAARPDEDALNRARFKVLETTVEKAATGSSGLDPEFDWNGVLSRVETAEEGLQELLAAGLSVAEDVLGRFKEKIATFREHHARHVASEAERRRRDEAERALLETQAALCERMEAIYADPRPADPEEVKELSRRFDEAGHGPEGNPMRERFRLARERVTKEKLRKQREAETADQRQQQAETAQARLEALVEKAENLQAKSVSPPLPDPDTVAALVKALQKDWAAATAHVEPQMSNALLAERFGRAIDALRDSLEAARRGVAESLEAAVTELGALAASTDLRAAEKRLRELQGLAKGWLKSLDVNGAEVSDLVARWHTASDHLRDTLEWNRWSNLKRKEDVCDRLEALLKAQDEKADTDLRPVFARFKDLSAEWKSIGAVPWDANDALWERYHTVSDALYEKCREFFAELESEREANLKRKEELCERLEGLLADSAADLREVGEAFREAHTAWKDMGAVPKDKSDALWERFRAANKQYQERRGAHLKDNLRAKQELIDLVESLKDSTEWRKTAERIKEAQERWKAIGPVPRDKSDAVWKRFHDACETFFKARRAHYEELDRERPLNLEKKLALCELVEGLDALETDDEKYARILEAQAQWKAIGPVPREQEDEIWQRFRAPIDAYFDGRRERGAADREAREEGIRIKEDICTEAESLPRDGDRREVVDKIRTLQAQWKAAPAAPRAMERELWQRFRTACDAFFEGGVRPVRPQGVRPLE